MDWRNLKSFLATGARVGFGGFGGGAPASVYAKAPDRRTLIIDFKGTPGRGDTTRSYDGHRGWLRTPLNIPGEYELSGGELDGARLDAELSFPGQIKQVRTNVPTDPAMFGRPAPQQTAGSR